MSSEISFCPLCAGKLDSAKKERFVCDDCETKFLIQIVDEDEDVDDEDDEDDDDDDEDEEDDEEDDEEEDDDDEY